jgi:hypothetical protein
MSSWISFAQARASIEERVKYLESDAMGLTRRLGSAAEVEAALRARLLEV